MKPSSYNTQIWCLDLQGKSCLREQSYKCGQTVKLAKFTEKQIGRGKISCIILMLLVDLYSPFLKESTSSNYK